ncbi:hypothetical protein NQF86_00260 [Bombella sp. TMW 2.2543]|uniref:Uncharacterized protein n=1 Tax=Bombella pluederhausensis TaxID=2967336 RepID=A0ABT3WDE2_9PROT|nr:hypothetical protein [Bombella pluederhausensis]MCX5617105.1 hypothetical protein [Bombella pluederhausensis]
MTQNMAYFAIIDGQTQDEPLPILGWSAIPLVRNSQTPEDPATSLPLTEDELLLKVQPHLPAGSRAIRLTITDEEWTARPTVNPALCNGTVIQRERPALPLKEQAASAIQQVHHQAALSTAMGQTFGPEMQNHVRKLQAILDGTDTTSTALPPQPSSPLQ